MKHLLILVAVALLIAAPLVTFGQATIPDPGQTVLAEGAGGVVSLIKTITNWLFTILLVLAVVFIILAAFKYLTSGGGEEVGAAHKMLIYAVVAIAVAFLAKGIVFVVEELVTSGGGGSSLNGSNGSLQVQFQNKNVGVRVGIPL